MQGGEGEHPNHPSSATAKIRLFLSLLSHENYVLSQTPASNIFHEELSSRKSLEGLKRNASLELRTLS